MLVALHYGKLSYCIPTGITISNNQITSYTEMANIIGFNKNHKLILGNFSAEEAINKGIRDCVSFDPFLIINGEKSQVLGNGGSGRSPRTAIGQRADGIVLFLVIDGNRLSGKGATMQDLIDIFERYGAINAANLDGGNSSSMTVKNKTINNPVENNGNTEMRIIPTAFILQADNSDNGDYSIVKDKVNK